MSRIMVMSNFMNFQDFDILSDGMFEIRGLYLCNVIPVISVQPILYQLPYGAKKNWGVFFMVFSINYTIPYRTPKEDPQWMLGECVGLYWESLGLSRCLVARARDY